VVLAQAFLQRAIAAQPRAPKTFSSDALVAIQRHDWPGNVRELENKVRSAVIMASGPQITAEDLGLSENTGRFVLLNLKAVRTAAEKQAVQQALAVVDGNVSAAAELLGITRPTLYDLMQKFDLRVNTGKLDS
jgi:two-component system NtrC family response regulator